MLKFEWLSHKDSSLSVGSRYQVKFWPSLQTSRVSNLQSLFRGCIGHPPWRHVQFAIAPSQEQKVRLLFWHTVGFKQAEHNWWIAWVPEQGHFEINVSLPYESPKLQQFWQIAPTQYRYVVIANDGTLLTTR
jgi:hypothetical protein